MPRQTMEMRSDDMREIEEGKLRKNCRACDSPDIILVRVNGTEGNIFTQTLVGVCSREMCFRYADLKQLPSWKRTHLPSSA